MPELCKLSRIDCKGKTIVKARGKDESEQQEDKEMEYALVGHGCKCHRFALKL